MSKIYIFLTGLSLLANNHVSAGGLLRGRNLEESSLSPSLSPTARDSRCDSIEALEQDNKMMCRSDCSDSYLTCSNGTVISMPMAEGTKCYKNDIANVTKGECAIKEEVVTYFEVMDACMNYPDLEHCASTADPTSPPYKGAVFQDDAWYFVDQIWYSYVSTYSRENGKGWDINMNIRFGHDQEAARSRSIIASIDHEATEIRSWTQYDLLDGDEAHYNCLSGIPVEPTTKLIAQLIKDPAVIFAFGKGEFERLDDEDVHNYTAQVTMSASELGEDYDGEGDVDVLVASIDATNDTTADDAEPVITPTFLLRKLIVYDDESDYAEDENEVEGFEDIEDDAEEIEDDESERKSIEEVCSLFDTYFNVTFNHTICSENFETMDIDDPNTLVRVMRRGNLTVGEGEIDIDSNETITNGTDPISRRLMQLTKKGKQEDILIPQHSITDCKDGEILVDHCCHEDIHFLSCRPQEGQDCPSGTVTSSRCLEVSIADDIILEPHFLKGNIPMQLHTAEHLESIELNPDHILTEPEPIDQSERQLFWHDLDDTKWVHQAEEDLLSEINFFPNVANTYKKTQWFKSSTADSEDELIDMEELEALQENAEELYDSFGDIFLGRGGGLPNVKDLLNDLNDLDETLTNFYELTTDLEGDMHTIYALMHTADVAGTLLGGIDDTLKTLHRVLKLVQIIKYIKPIAVPIAKSIESARKLSIGPALSKLNNIRESVTKKHKPNVKKFMEMNEDVRSALLTARFLNRNLLITPFNTTRNCGPTDDAAKAINAAIDYAKIDTEWAFEEILDFRLSMKALVVDLSGVIDLVQAISDALEKMADVISPISLVMNPFHIALNKRITLDIKGPFCPKTYTKTIKYPCGVKTCRHCRRIFGRKRCTPRYKCGIRWCSKRTRFTVPTFCTKRFSFTINEVLNGIAGIMDIVFYPINKAVDAILSAIPIPDIPLLPDFPFEFEAFDLFPEISFHLEGPKFPSFMFDVPDITLALPGLGDLVCGKNAGDLLEVFQLSATGDITPDFIRDFYDDCGGWQDLNPVCHDTQELLCGDGGCPSESPSESPTISFAPSESPSESPSTSVAPSESPSQSPTQTHSVAPTMSVAPSEAPSMSPTSAPSEAPTASQAPTEVSSMSPTVTHSEAPSTSFFPSESPTMSAAPSESPTATPTNSPSVAPSVSHAPSGLSSMSPTVTHSEAPSVSQSPSKSPTVSPTGSPVEDPTLSPTVSPTVSPTNIPVEDPTQSPTVSPTDAPTESTMSPTVNPTKNPTASPTVTPTAAPTVSPTKSPVLDLSDTVTDILNDSEDTTITVSINV